VLIKERGRRAFRISSDQATDFQSTRKCLTLCVALACWCARADVMFNVPGIQVLWVEIDDRQRLVVAVESDQLEAGCPSCDVVAAGYGRRVHPLHDAPCFDRVTLVRWRKRNRSAVSGQEPLIDDEQQSVHVARMDAFG
jgi:hypothetical protein